MAYLQGTSTYTKCLSVFVLMFNLWGGFYATFFWRFEGNGWQEEAIVSGEVIERQAVIA